MDTRKLEATHWQTYFDDVSRRLRASRVEIEVSGLDVGNQVVTSRIAIDGLTYDPEDDEVVITAEQFEHHIARPREIYVIEELGQLSCFDVLDGDGHQQLVLLIPVESLPAP